MLRDLLSTTLRSVWAHAFRFALTALGIVWGAAMLTYLSAMADGYDRHFEAQIDKLGQRIVFLFPGVATKLHVGQRGARPVELEREDVDRVAALHAVERAAPNLWLGPRVVRAAGRTKLVHTYGGSEETAALRSFEMAAGRFLGRRDVDLARNVVVLGPRAAERLFAGAPAVGRTVHVEGIPFEVIGVARAKGDQLLFMGPLDDEVAFVPFTTARTWFTRTDVVDQLVFAPLTREGSWDAVRLVRATLGRHHGFRQDDDAAMGYFNVQEAVDIVHGLLLALRLFLTAASLVTLFAGAVGVMNIMLVMVAERTREIGLKKAIGASNRRIFLEVVAETLLVTALAGLVGVLLAWLGVELSARGIAPGQTMQGPPLLAARRVVVILVTLIGVALASAVLPALRAIRTDPASALRAT
ncbi:MAG: ABC transporter permease [Thermodesulfobacteriota bacterium]